jgi:hypothetical protein
VLSASAAFSYGLTWLLCTPGAQPSLATVVLRSRRREHESRHSSFPLLAETRGGVSHFLLPCSRARLMGATGGPKSRTPSDYNTPPPRSSVTLSHLSLLYDYSSVPSSLLSEARKLIPLSWDRRGTFILFIFFFTFLFVFSRLVRPQTLVVSLVTPPSLNPRLSRPRNLCPCLRSYCQLRRLLSLLELLLLMLS